MAYLVISDFRRGVDRRRPITAGQPGQLWRCDNADISRGGDIVRAKAWTKVAQLPAGCFGLGYAGGTLWTFGSNGQSADLPAALLYQRLEHPKGLPMTAVLDVELFDGQFYVIAEYNNGDVLHFYKGKLVEEIYKGSGRFSGSVAGVADALVSAIAADGYIVRSIPSGPITRLYIEGRAGQSYAVEASVSNLGKTDDGRATVVVQRRAVQPKGLVRATATLSVLATSGTITALKVEGVSLIPAPITAVADIHETADALRVAINSGTGAHGFSATRVGPTVTISSDKPVNGRLLQVTQSAAGVTSGNVLFDGYQSQNAGQSQLVMVQFEGAYEPEDRYQIKIDGKLYGFSGGPTTVGRSAKTHRNKLFTPGGSVLNFSALNDPTRWGLDQTGQNIGAGFVNMQTAWGGSEPITAIENFNGSLAVFSASCVQIWDMDPDPQKIQLVQTIPNIGAVSRRASVAGMSGVDASVMFLSRAGIRTINPRGSSVFGSLGNIGAPVDALVLADMAASGTAILEKSCAFVEPSTDNVFVLVGTRAYRLVYDASNKISAWTRADLPGVFDHVAVAGDSVCALSGDAVYQYGGPSGDDVTDAEIVVEMPYLALEKPAHIKALTGIDVTCEGSWIVEMRTDPSHPEAKITIAEVQGSTWIGPNVLNVGQTTHASFVLRCKSPGPASLSALCIHYETGNA